MTFSQIYATVREHAAFLAERDLAMLSVVHAAAAPLALGKEGRKTYEDTVSSLKRIIWPSSAKDAARKLFGAFKAKATRAAP